MRWFWLLPILFVPALPRAETLAVFVAVSPMQVIVERVGGAHVDVTALVGPGHSPETYEPGPQQIAALARAALYVRVGIPFEAAWMDRIRAANPAMQVLDLAAAVAGPQPHARSERGRRGAGAAAQGAAGGAPHHDHGADAPDAHLWTSPPLVQRMIGPIRDALAALDPARAGVYRRNHDAFHAELARLHGAIRARLAPFEGRRFVVFHPAWGHFAAAYGLVQVAMEAQGKAPGARRLAALIEQARRDGVRAVFVQPQFDQRLAQRLADAIGAGLVTADPLAPDYPDNLRRLARQLEAALAP